MSGLTGIAESRRDASAGPLAPEARHAAVGHHAEGVVEVGVQVGHDDRGVPEGSGARFEADLLATGDAGFGPVRAALTHDAVGEVRPSPGHQRGAPGQLQPAL